MSAPRNVYMVNYFPAQNAGSNMWTNYSHSQTLTDMQLAKNLGFNTMRIFIPSDNVAFNFFTPTAGQLANLTDFYNCAKTIGIKLHMTLFDGWGNYGQPSHSQSFISNILGALPDTTALQCVEIQNETPFASTSSYSGGFDSGWPSGTTQYSTVGPVALVWAQIVIPYIRTIVPGIPVTASARGEGLTTGGIEDLITYYAAVNGTAAAPDWYDWHCYTYNNLAGGVYYQLQRAISAVGGDPSVLFIGETGYGTGSTVQTLQAEVDWLQTVRWACQQLGLGEPSIWILFDITNGSGGWSSGQTYGLYDANGVLKLAGSYYQAVPPGSAVIPASGLNGNLQGSWSDVNNNTVPYRWYVYKGNNGAQPIVTTIDTTTSYQGHPTILLTGSSATVNTDNPPGVYYMPLTWPLITAGQNYTVTVALKGVGSSLGQPSLSISWYSPTAYLSGVNGTILSLTSSFVTYSTSGVAPAGATYARLSVNTGYNAGSIWVGSITWVGQSPRLASRNGQWYRK